MPEKKKPKVSPEAAKILEQYRNASKQHTPEGVSPEGSPGPAVPPRNAAPPPGGSMRRSGTRGK